MSLVPDLGSAFGGPLVAAPVSVSSPFDGLWLVQDGMSLADSIQSGNWVEGGMAAFALLADGVAALIDPIGTLIGMGLSWVLEHIWPLNEYLNALTGNAGEVLRMSQTWANISNHLVGVGGDLNRILGDLEGLEGAAMDAYRKFQSDVAEHIQLAGTLAGATSAALEIASTIVKVVHDLTRDVISQIAGTAISAAITTAATVGFGAPLAIAQVAARVSALVPKVTRGIEALVRSFEALEPLLKKIDEIYFALKQLLDRVLPGYHGPSGRHPTGLKPASGPPWELRHPTTQNVLDDLKAAGANGPPGYDPTGGLGWQDFMDQYYRGTNPAGQPQWNWPGSHGFADGISSPSTYQAGDTFSRITALDARGVPVDGNFGAPPGTPFPEMALPPDRLGDDFVTINYEVLKPLPPGTEQGAIDEGFGQVGGGQQLYTPQGIEYLIAHGFIKVVP
ncbi:hypothetical protein BH11ACT3_BH11ACT3_12410 [soil metagenome]